MLLYSWVGRNSITASRVLKSFFKWHGDGWKVTTADKNFDQIFSQGNYMNKSILIAAIAALGLAACGKEEPKVVPAPKVEMVVPAAPAAPVVAPMVDAVKDAAGKSVEAAKDAAGKTIEAAKDSAGKTMEAAKDAAGKTMDAAKDSAAKTVDAAKDSAAKAVEAAKAAAPKK